MGSIGSTKTSGTIYQSTLRIIKEELRSYFHSAGSLKSGIIAVFHFRHYVDFNRDGLRKIKKLLSLRQGLQRDPSTCRPYKLINI